MLLVSETALPQLADACTVVKVPPLRVRPSDVRTMQAYFLRNLARQRDLPGIRLSDDAGGGAGSEGRKGCRGRKGRSLEVRVWLHHFEGLQGCCMTAVQLHPWRPPLPPVRSLESYTYPLNISELKTMVERAATQVGVRVHVCVCARMCTCEGVPAAEMQRCSIGAGQQLGGGE